MLPTSPTVVARIRMTGQTAPVPQTTVFTPTQNGVYRATTYMSVTVPGDGANFWVMNLFWTDEAGLETSPLALLGDSYTPPHAYAFGPDQFSPAGSITFRAVSGTPVRYDIDNNSPSGVYEAFLVIERVE